jgi:hypothetical protein
LNAISQDYNSALAGGSNKIQAAYVAVGHALGKYTGVEDFYDALTGNGEGGQLGIGQRVWAGVSSAIMSGTTTLGIKAFATAGWAAFFGDEAASSGPQTVGELLSDATRGSASKTLQYTKTGGMTRAATEFDSLVGDAQVTTHPNGVRSATLPDGSTVSVRAQSTQGAPTIQITPSTGRQVKVRYEQ